MKRLLLNALISAFLVFGFGQTAWAHKVIASVFASGDVIEGEIGFSNGDMAANTLVEIFDEQGDKIGETETDADGFFSYKPTARIVHIFHANLGAGHIADVRMEVEELPEIATTEEPGQPDTGTGQQASTAQAAPSAQEISKDQRKLIAEIIHREVNPLRREIAAYKEKNDLQTILGGIGYIAGLFGVGFYLAARRKLGKA